MNQRVRFPSRQALSQDAGRFLCGVVSQLPKQTLVMNIWADIFARMRNSPGKTSGEAIAESTGGVNLVDGKQTWELVEGKKDDLDTMRKCCDAELATYEKVGLVPAPYYFERVAILARRLKDFQQEVAC